MAGAAASAAPPSADRKLVLVLGMAYAPNAGTDTAVRDTARLLALQRHEPSTIVGCGFSSGADALVSTEHGHIVHCEAAWSRLGLKSLQQELERHSLSGHSFATIYLDYWRMPGAYLTEAARPFFCEMLPKMVKSSLVTAGTRIVCPLRRELLETFRQLEFAATPLLAEQSALWRESQSCTDATLHAGQLQSCHPDYPFALLQLSDSAASGASVERLEALWTASGHPVRRAADLPTLPEAQRARLERMWAAAQRFLQAHLKERNLFYEPLTVRDSAASSEPPLLLAPSRLVPGCVGVFLKDHVDRAL
jgi:hypothetical protein